MSKAEQGKPHAGFRLTIYLERRILELRPKKTQGAIASEAGFINPNVLAMIKAGRTKLPLDRVPALAKALDCDPVMLFTLALDQREGSGTELAIRQIFRTLVTENETAWLEEIRDASGHSDPGVTTKARAAIRGIFGK